MAKSYEHTLTIDNVFSNLRRMEYAVRGPLLLRALEIEKELEKVFIIVEYLIIIENIFHAVNLPRQKIPIFLCASIVDLGIFCLQKFFNVLEIMPTFIYFKIILEDISNYFIHNTSSFLT